MRKKKQPPATALVKITAFGPHFEDLEAKHASIQNLLAVACRVPSASVHIVHGQFHLPPTRQKVSYDLALLVTVAESVTAERHIELPVARLHRQLSGILGWEHAQRSLGVFTNLEPHHCGVVNMRTAA